MHLRSPLLTLQICGDMPCLNMRVHEFELPHPLMEITPQIYFTFLIFLKSEIKAAPSSYYSKKGEFCDVRCGAQPALALFNKKCYDTRQGNLIRTWNHVTNPP